MSGYCKIDDCERPRHCRGWCKKHYERWRKHGTTADPDRVVAYNGAECLVDECNRAATSRGWCKAHYGQWRAGHTPSGKIVSKVGVPMHWLRLMASSPRADECIAWPFGYFNNGYGAVRVDGRSRGAHRVSLAIATGSHLSSDREAAHSCANPGCVNPDHLRWATKLENEADKVAHGNSLRGSKSYRSKLSEQQVLDIFSRLGSRGDAEVAAEFGVTPQCIYGIRNGKSWGWLTQAEGTA